MSSLPVYQPVAAKPAAYSTPVLLRFAWQQTRKLWPFAAGVAVLALVFLAMLAPLQDRSALPIGGTVAAGLVGVLVVVGGSIVAFSVEREEQTIHYLRTLPRHWLALYLGKVGATLGCAVAATGAVLLAAVPVVGVLPRVDGTVASQYLAFFGEALAWATLASLLCPHPILATVLGCAAILVSQQLWNWLLDWSNVGYLVPDFDATTHRLIIAGVVLVVDAALVRRWLSGRERGIGRLQLRPPRDLEETAVSATLAPVRLRSFLPRLTVEGPTTQAMTGRLLWQTLRKAWTGALASVVAAGTIVTAYWWLTNRQPSSAVATAVLTATIVASLCGALAFHNDQQANSYRYLAVHACRPGVLWRVRLGVWGAIAGLIILSSLVLVALIAYLTTRNVAWMDVVQGYGSIDGDDISREAASAQLADWLRYGLLQGLLTTATLFAIGQLASMLLRSGILAVAASFLAIVLCYLIAVVVIRWRLPPVLVYLPILVGCLLATRFRISDWLTERNSRRGWTKTILAVVVPLGFIAAAVPIVRLEQIAWASRQVNSSVGDPLRAAVDDYQRRTSGAEAAGRQYEALFREIHHSGAGEARPGDRFDYEEVEPIYIERLIELTEAPATRLAARIGSPRRVLRLLDIGFDQALEAGNLDDALRHALAMRRYRHLGMTTAEWWPRETGETEAWEWSLVRWATAAGQTADNILEAIRQIEAVDQHFPPARFMVVNEYLRAEELLTVGIDRLVDEAQHLDDRVALAAHELPWEARRTSIALEVLATMTLDYVDGIINSPDRIGLASLLERVDGSRAIVRVYDSAEANVRPPRVRRRAYKAEQTARSSLLADQLWPDRMAVNRNLTRWLSAQTTLHATRMRLALIAYHWDHGRYPESIDDLPPAYRPSPPTTHHDAKTRYSIIEPTAELLFEPLDKRFGGNGVLRLLAAPASTLKMRERFEYWLQAEVNYSRSVLVLRLPGAEAFQAPPMTNDN